MPRRPAMPDARLRNMIGWSGIGFLAAIFLYGLLVLFGVVPG